MNHVLSSKADLYPYENTFQDTDETYSAFSITQRAEVNEIDSDNYFIQDHGSNTKASIRISISWQIVQNKNRNYLIFLS